MMEFNIDKLLKNVEKVENVITEDQQIVREILEVCSDINKLTLEFLDKIKARHLIMAKKELQSQDKKILNDMVVFEYMLENINSANTFIDDEDEIY